VGIAAGTLLVGGQDPLGLGAGEAVAPAPRRRRPGAIASNVPVRYCQVWLTVDGSTGSSQPLMPDDRDEGQQGQGSAGAQQGQPGPTALGC
jgi:hypothetical protein